MDVSFAHASVANFLRAYLGHSGYAKMLGLPLRPPTREMLQRWPNARCFRAISRRPASRIGRLLGRMETIVLVVSDDTLSEVIITQRRSWWLGGNVLLRRQLRLSDDLHRWKIQPESRAQSISAQASLSL